MNLMKKKICVYLLRINANCISRYIKYHICMHIIHPAKNFFRDKKKCSYSTPTAYRYIYL